MGRMIIATVTRRTLFQKTTQSLDCCKGISRESKEETLLFNHQLLTKKWVPVDFPESNSGKQNIYCSISFCNQKKKNTNEANMTLHEKKQGQSGWANKNRNERKIKEGIVYFLYKILKVLLWHYGHWARSAPIHRHTITPYARAVRLSPIANDATSSLNKCNDQNYYASANTSCCGDVRACLLGFTNQVSQSWGVLLG